MPTIKHATTFKNYEIVENKEGIPKTIHILLMKLYPSVTLYHKLKHFVKELIVNGLLLFFPDDFFACKLNLFPTWLKSQTTTHQNLKLWNFKEIILN